MHVYCTICFHWRCAISVFLLYQNKEKFIVIDDSVICMDFSRDSEMLVTTAIVYTNTLTHTCIYIYE